MTTVDILKAGNRVSSKSYPEKGPGNIVNIESIFGEVYCDVYFDKTREQLSLPESDLKILTSAIDELKNSSLDSLNDFIHRNILADLNSTLTQSGILSASNFKIMPLPHQILAVNFVLENFKPRCLIADEVGLGKTIEAALIFEELKLRNLVKRVLIIAPSGLTHQWRDELKSKFEENFTLYDRDTAKSLFDIHGDSKNIWSHYDRIITSLDFIKPKAISDRISEKERKRREKHNELISNAAVIAHWDMVIFDEAHKLSKGKKGDETARYKIGHNLSEAAPIFLLLSATPHQGDAQKFKNLLSLVDPYLFETFDQLKPENVKKVTVRNKKRAVVDFDGNRIFKHRITSLYEIDRNNPECKLEIDLYKAVSDYINFYYNLALREGNHPFMFLLMLYQRMVSSSTQAIHDSLIKRLKLLNSLKQDIETINKFENNELDLEELSEEDAERIYARLEQAAIILKDPEQLNKEIIVLENCVNLAKKALLNRQDEKARKVIEIIDEVTRRENNPNTKFLVFTEFVSTQQYLGKILEDCGYKVAYLNGRMNVDEKMVAKEEFKNSAQFLISTDAGGEGINLQFCHVMINYDLPWNPMRLEQRIGRLDRIGQTFDVLVFNMVLRETVEQRVRDILETKLHTIASQFGEDKLADILSTLQDEFNFDRIYTDAVILRQNQAEALNKIAEEMFNKAKEILEKDDFVLPFSEINKDKLKGTLITTDESRIKLLVESFLNKHNLRLNEYAKTKNVFYFDSPLNDSSLKNKYSNVVFNKELALENEIYDYFSLGHPFIKKIIELGKQEFHKGKTSSVIIKDKMFSSRKGLLNLYELYLNNNEGYCKNFLIPVFIDQISLNYDVKVSNYLRNIDRLNLLLNNHIPIELIDDLNSIAQKTADNIAEDYFVNEKINLINMLEVEKDKINRYYIDKEKAISRIAIDNIRKSKEKEMQNNHINDLKRLDLRKNLVPKINLVQSAWVEFQG